MIQSKKTILKKMLIPMVIFVFSSSVILTALYLYEFDFKTSSDALMGVNEPYQNIDYAVFQDVMFKNALLFISALLFLYIIAILYVYNRSLSIKIKPSDEIDKLIPILDHFPEGIIIIDSLGDIQSVNTGIEKIFEYKKQKLIGENINFIVPGVCQGGNEAGVDKSCQIAVASDCESSREVVGKRVNGTIFTLEMKVNKIYFSECMYYIVIVQDLTGEKHIASEIEDRKYEHEIIFNSVPIRIWYKDSKNTILRLNEQAAESMGMSVKEVEGKNTYDLFPSMARLYHDDDLEVIKSGKPKLGIIEEYKPYRGTCGWVKTDKVPYRDKDGSVAGVIVLSQDITSLKNAEIAFKASEERFRLAVEGTNDGVWDWPDLEKDEQYWSPQFKRLLGYHVHEIQPGFATLKSMIHLDDLSGVEKAINECTQNEKPYDVECRLQTKTGEYKWFRAKGVILREESGKAYRLTGSISDINNHKKAQNAQQTLYEIISDYTLSMEEKVNQVLLISLRYFGLRVGIVCRSHDKKNTILYTKWLDGIGTCNNFNFDIVSTQSSINTNKIIALNEVGDEDRKLLYKFGSFRVDAYIGAPIYVNGELFGFLGFFSNEIRKNKFSDEERSYVRLVAERVGTEITRAKYVQKLEVAEINLENMVNRLTQSNEDLEQFAYVASHDLREPLRMVTNFTGLLKKQYTEKLDEKAFRYIQFSVDAAKRMQDLIDDLLDYARLNSDDVITNKEVNSDEVLKHVCENLRDQIQESGAEIHASKLHSVCVNPVRFSRIMQNLISNAIKYQAPGNKPIIDITSVERRDHWEFSIADNGIGINSDYYNKIFLPFKRLHDNSQYNGTGIGLAVCKKIIESWGGRLHVQSKLNEGSTFYFTIIKIANKVSKSA